MQKQNNARQLQIFAINPLNCTNLEFSSIVYFRDLIKDVYDVKLTCEGCLADLAIKPKTIQEDLWIKVQMKSTSKPGRDYGFHCSSQYKNCVVICLCHSNKQMWLIDGNTISVKYKIAIGLKKSKYDVWKVPKDEIFDKLENFYNNMIKFNYGTIDTPISVAQQLEHEYVKYRESMITCLEFETNERQGLVYDFKVNNYKVQEKVGNKPKNKAIITFTFFKNNGSKKYRSYQSGDNDFYWFNVPNKKQFYVIPEHVLIARKYMDIEKKVVFSLNPSSKDSWASKYMFDYTNLNSEKLIAMFASK